MKQTLKPQFINELFSEIRSVEFPVSPRTLMQPVHVVYGGAQLFSVASAAKLGSIALKTMSEYVRDTSEFADVFGLDERTAAQVFESVKEKLTTEPVEDLRVDFEDGYGYRSDNDEDGHAAGAADASIEAMANNMLPKFFGIRIKPLSVNSAVRAVKTLDIYLTRFANGNVSLPENFAVTLPKVEDSNEVEALCKLLTRLEKDLGFAANSISVEIMIETPNSLIDKTGNVALASLVDAADGRCRGAHFGAYDYTAALGIASSSQSLFHQACDHARNLMQITLADHVWLSDGATNVMPVGRHRGDALTEDQIAENIRNVHDGLRLHFNNCLRSLDNGFYQGWDLHPAQLIARYAAVYAFYFRGLTDASARLKNFVDKAAQASLVGSTFDDAATGQGLLNFFLRAIACGAISADNASAFTGLSLKELDTRSFPAIINERLRSQ